MTTRADIIAEARTWIGTKWVHQGRLKGIACDCVGHIVKVPVACGLFPPDFDINGYPRTPEPNVMLGFLKQYCDRVTGQPRGGDILFIRSRRLPQHLGIYTDKGTIIHAIDEVRGVREHRLDPQRLMVCSVWSYRGLAD